MNFYEIVIILNYIDIFKIKKFISVIENFFICNNCLVIKLERWGFRNFSYPIRKISKGYYICFNVKLNFYFFNKIKYYLKFNINVLRFLFIRLKRGDINISYFVMKELKLKLKKKNINIINSNIKNKYIKYKKINY